MTATEGLLASQNGPVGSVYASTTANAATGSPHKYEISDVAISFGQEYYTMMSYDPESLHCFYKKHSTALHCSDAEKDAIVCIGLEQIHQSISSMGYKGARVIVSNIDCQQTLNGGILIFVLGEFHWPNGIVRKFAQTLVLAEQPGGYFILNDILRVLEDDCRPVSDPQAASTGPASVEPAAPPKAALETKPVTGQKPVDEAISFKEASVEPIGTKAEAASPETAKSVAEKPSSSSSSASSGKGKNNVEGNQKNAKKTVKTAAASSSAALQAPKQDSFESKEEKLPSSWAKLAAVQQNRWGTGVVAESKGPVASIPVEGDGKKNGPSAVKLSFKTAANPRIAGNHESQSAGGEGGAAGPRDRRSLGDFDVSKSIYVHGIVAPADSGSIRKLFEQFGAIKSYDFVRSRGIAFIEFETSSAQGAALKANLVWNDAPIIVETRRGPRRDSAQEKGREFGNRRTYPRGEHDPNVSNGRA